MQVHGWAAWNILKSKRCGPSREGQRTLFELNQLSNSKDINIYFFLFTITQGKERNCLQLWPRSNLIKGLYSYKRTHFHLFIWKRKPWSRDKVVANRGRQRGQRAPLGGQRTMAGTGEADAYIIGDTVCPYKHKTWIEKNPPEAFASTPSLTTFLPSDPSPLRPLTPDFRRRLKKKKKKNIAVSYRREARGARRDQSIN